MRTWQSGAVPLIAALPLTGTVLVHSPVWTQQPNIVLVLMDNFGYGELGSYGGGITRGAPTPRLDKLASEGMRLTNFDVLAGLAVPFGEGRVWLTGAYGPVSRIPSRVGDDMVVCI